MATAPIKDIIIDGVGFRIVSEAAGASPVRGNIRSDESVQGQYGNSQWAMWGSNDTYPTYLRHKIEASDIARRTLHNVAAMLYGRGVRTYRNEYIDGKEQRSFFKHPEFEAFRRENNLDKKLLTAVIQFVYYENIFAELLKNRNLDKIARLNFLQPEYCRLPLNLYSKSGMDFLRFNPKFTRDLNQMPTDDESVKIPLYDDLTEDFFNEVRSARFAMHIKNASPGRNTYALPVHSALFKPGGWVDVTIEVPKAINRMVKNHVNFKWQISIPEDYWYRSYPQTSDSQGWLEFSAEKQKAIMDKKFQEFENCLRSDQNLGFFYTHYQVDQTGRSLNEGWKIIPIEGKTQSDWVPSSDAADAKIVRTIGYDTSNAIGGTGGGIGAGSGSDKRVGQDNTYEQLQMIEAIILEPLNYIAQVNGWGDVNFTFVRAQPETLNANPTGQALKS